MAHSHSTLHALPGQPGRPPICTTSEPPALSFLARLSSKSRLHPRFEVMRGIWNIVESCYDDWDARANTARSEVLVDRTPFGRFFLKRIRECTDLFNDRARSHTDRVMRVEARLPSLQEFYAYRILTPEYDDHPETRSLILRLPASFHHLLDKSVLHKPATAERMEDREDKEDPENKEKIRTSSWPFVDKTAADIFLRIWLPAIIAQAADDERDRTQKQVDACQARLQGMAVELEKKARMLSAILKREE